MPKFHCSILKRKEIIYVRIPKKVFRPLFHYFNKRVLENFKLYILFIDKKTGKEQLLEVNFDKANIKYISTGFYIKLPKDIADKLLNQDVLDVVIEVPENVLPQYKISGVLV